MTQLIIVQEISNDPIKIFINSQSRYVEAGDIRHDAIKFLKPRVMMIGNQSLDKVTKDTVRNDWMKPEEARDYGIAGQITHRWDKLHGY
ncbi:hypothetical protein TCT1_24120 [Xenorhabdus sp. TCT-1]|uniref:ATP-dependent Clp protease proteolytic subunit n=1 Tax=Xenorhabdus taiwanensis TaxID=3085177 RepID=A0ABM8JXS2_9GAMM|nr:hypothetical protein TCT1_24120 [Xenorhabdus sp. TCT-1]